MPLAIVPNGEDDTEEKGVKRRPIRGKSDAAMRELRTIPRFLAVHTAAIVDHAH